MKNFEIKITGSGTIPEITKSLDLLCNAFRLIPDSELSRVEWEDPTLCTELDEEDIKCPECYSANIEQEPMSPEEYTCLDCGFVFVTEVENAYQTRK